MWNEWVSSVMPDLEGPRVLEIGYGPGHLQVELNQKEVSTFGLDLSTQMARLANRRLIKLGFPPYITLGQAQHLPYTSQSFNQLVSTFPSDFIFDQLALAEAYRVLIPGGRFVILPVAWIEGGSRLERIASWLFRSTGQSPEWDDRFTEPLSTAGFMLHVEKRTCKSATLLVINAHKPPS
jgi:ubiquinone/menaquinone biosynthesis C-methylase UbiE